MRAPGKNGMTQAKQLTGVKIKVDIEISIQDRVIMGVSICQRHIDKGRDHPGFTTRMSSGKPGFLCASLLNISWWLEHD